MTSEELLELAQAIPHKDDGRNVWVRFRPAAFVLREKGYQWPEIAETFIQAGETVPNVESFCASMSRSYNDHLRKISRSDDETSE